MIGSSRAQRVFAYGAPVDMRKGYDGLYALVTHEMKSDPLSGDVYLFVGRSRRRAKALLWDGTGLCIYAKRLEQGRFAAPWVENDEAPMRMTMSELALFFEGSELVGRVPLSPAPFVLGEQKKNRAHV